MGQAMRIYVSLDSREIVVGLGGSPRWPDQEDTRPISGDAGRPVERAAAELTTADPIPNSGSMASNVMTSSSTSSA